MAGKREVVHVIQKYLLNPPVKGALLLGFPPTQALVETTGRTTGKPRRTPVGNGLADDGRTFWIVSEHGRHSGYVKNILADPRVRVRLGRRWHRGTAELLPDDDPLARLKTIGHRVNAAGVRAWGTDLLTVKITLDEPVG